MPYITEQEREWLDKHFVDTPIRSEGQLNYVITKLAHLYVLRTGTLNYSIINEVLGAMEGAKLEFYRTVAAPYEDKKCEQNGRISKIDGSVV